MESFVVPDGMVGVAIVIAVLIGFLREIKWVAERSRFLPYLSIAFGVAAAYMVDRLQPSQLAPGEVLNRILQTGVLVGMLACGGYDALKIPLERIRGKVPPSAPMILLLIGLLTLAGCAGVYLAPEYEQTARRANAIVQELDSRCQAGDGQACKDGLNAAAQTLQLLIDAHDGVDSSAVQNE